MNNDKKIFVLTKCIAFSRPAIEIKCNSSAQIVSKLSLAQEMMDKGYYLAGYFSYEFGHYLLKKAGAPFRSKTPLFYLAAFKKPCAPKALSCGEYIVSGAKPDTSAAEYSGKFKKIKALIKSGEIYQANECFKLKFKFEGDAQAFFGDLLTRQAADYPAFIDDGERRVLSISPELFFKIERGIITMKPMKGTVLKVEGGGWKAEGKPETELWNEKNKAENIMIVDLIRNDLGKICETNSVKAGPLFEVKEYKTLYQMTSTVKGKLKKSMKLSDLLTAIFPSGSVTGAPKIRAVQVIRDTEKSARGIYTGAIGFFGPRMKTAVFNIPIRTVVIDKKGNAEMGIGSGIVHDSKAGREYEECLGKAKFLFPSLQGHSLIESILLENGKYFLLDKHLQRLMRSAAYFGVPVVKKKIVRVLRTQARRLGKQSYKVRLLVDAAGKIKVSGNRIVLCRDSAPRCPTGRAAVSKIVVNSGNIFLRHKTTNRDFYDNEYMKYAKKGYYDVIFFNEKNELTEAHSSNVFIKKNGVFYTPPISCGLLPGTNRQYLLDKGGKYREKVLRLKDLKTADEIYICNSVRGLRRVSL